ncbi:unnamed protein product [Fusarium fujikuroi]|uniref:Uncharacterized protein n=1 Tax=Fusarium fujikuroi TaxID=5127 RepID=A0A9Q9U716_FUSFU|nr:unnamed protein product [Fusarium fujikuroi]
MSWDRDDLDKKGFFFDDSIRITIPWAPFPPHVETLRQSMLDFTCQDFDVTSEEDAATQHEAKRYSEGGYSESDWEDFFRKKTSLIHLSKRPQGHRKTHAEFASKGKLLICALSEFHDTSITTIRSYCTYCKNKSGR